MFQRWLWAICVAFASATAVPASDLDDLIHTILARKALHDDASLRDLNLGVSVKARVATLWGTTPSADASRRAAAALRRLVELRDVVNELYLDPSLPDFLPEILPQVVPDPAPRPRVTDPAPIRQG